MKNQRQKVGIFYGGHSAEREVSLQSGQVVARHLPANKYEITLIDTGQGDFLGRWPELGLDVAFIALHGAGGEDGTLQGLLELHGLPYTGSGVLASALAMHKVHAKQVFRSAGIPTPPNLVLATDAFDPDALSRFGYPLVLKPPAQGSSVGVTIVRDEDEAWAGWKLIGALADQVLVEPFLRGTELTVGVYGGASPRALPVVEIVPKHSFFDYEAKYDPTLTDEIVPARVGPAETVMAQQLALAAHRALGCWGYSRSDMILHRGNIFVLETNTCPGLTENSLLPKALRAAGVSLAECFDQLVQLAFTRPGRMIGPLAGEAPRLKEDLAHKPHP